MSERSQASGAALPSALAQRVEEICDHFEAAWKAARATGARPEIEPFVGAASSSALRLASLPLPWLCFD